MPKIRGSHILVKTKTESKDILEELKKRVSFSTTSKENHCVHLERGVAIWDFSAEKI